jgi:hypothetical protein
MQLLINKYHLSVSFQIKWIRIFSCVKACGFITSVILLANSCTNYEDPSIETLVNYRFNYQNTNQISYGGEYLQDSIYVQIKNYISPFDASGFNVEFKVQKGGGLIDHQQVKTRKDGKAATRWKLGTDSFIQIVTARITGPDGNLHPEATITAHGILRKAWNEVDIYPLSNLIDLAADTVNHISWMISSGGIYKRGTNFLDWQPINQQKIQSARAIEIDKNGVIYIGTYNGELYKSTDHGLSWIKCTNPIPSLPNSFYFWITNDGDLWATGYNSGLWHSSDGGKTWINPANGADKNDFIVGINRLKDGSLLSIFGIKNLLMRSEDNGKTWTSFESPKYLGNLYVTEKQQIIVSDYTTPSNFFLSDDQGKSFRKIHSVIVSYATGYLEPNIQKFGSYYYILVSGTGILKTQNFEQFETILSEPNISGVYLDHTGSILAKGWRDKQNKTFIYNPE